MIVDAGTIRGGIDGLSWLDTDRTTLKVSDVDHKMQYYVTITAINKAGLYTKRTYVVSYTPT